MKNNIVKRGKWLYIHYQKDGVRVRLSTGLRANAENKLFVSKHFSEFVKDKNSALKKHKDFVDAEFDKASLPKSEKARRAFAKRGEGVFFIKNILDEILREKQDFKRQNTLKAFEFKAGVLLKFCDNCGIYDVRKIDRDFCKDFYKFLTTQNYAKGTLDLCFGVLFELLKFAYEDKELIDKNPYFKPKFSAAELKGSKELKAFDFEQAQRLIKSAQGEIKSYLIIAFFTGMRVGELLGLKFSDLDFEREIIKVQRTRLKNGETNAPKTQNSRREVLMLEPVKNELLRLNSRAENKGDFIFAKSRTLYTKAFKSLLERLNLPLDFTLYETRHSFASIMLQKGEEMAWISKMMGHKDLSITLQAYTAFLPDKSIKRAEFLCGVDFAAEPSLFSETAG